MGLGENIRKQSDRQETNLQNIPTAHAAQKTKTKKKPSQKNGQKMEIEISPKKT